MRCFCILGALLAFLWTGQVQAGSPKVIYARVTYHVIGQAEMTAFQRRATTLEAATNYLAVFPRGRSVAIFAHYDPNKGCWEKCHIIRRIADKMGPRHRLEALRNHMSVSYRGGMRQFRLLRIDLYVRTRPSGEIKSVSGQICKVKLN